MSVYTSTAAATERTSSAVDTALLCLRLALGLVFMVHGAQLVFGAFGGPGIVNFAKMMGPLGYLVAIGEFFGGLGIVVGFLSRFSAAALIVIMLGAIIKVHLPNGFFMNWYGKQAGEGYEYHLLVIGMAMALVLAGPGRFAVGRFLPLPKVAGTSQPVPVIE